MFFLFVCFILFIAELWDSFCFVSHPCKIRVRPTLGWLYGPNESYKHISGSSDASKNLLVYLGLVTTVLNLNLQVYVNYIEGRFDYEILRTFVSYFSFNMRIVRCHWNKGVPCVLCFRYIINDNRTFKVRVVSEASVLLIMFALTKITGAVFVVRVRFWQAT